MSVHEYQLDDAKCGMLSIALNEAGFSMEHAVFDVQTGLPSGTVRIEFFTDLTPEQVTALDTLMADYDGRVYRARSRRLLGIDGTTKRLTERGFTHDGQRFSLSSAAQANWNRMAAKHAAGKLTFPTNEVSTFYGGRYSFADATEYEAFEAAYFTAIEGVLESGRALRDQVNAATTVEDVDAVVDAREFPA